MSEVAILAAGCFWGVEEKLSKIGGVLSTRVGYTGGLKKFSNPSYEEVCSGKTGHAEAVKVVFDERVVSFKEILKHFWSFHDPTQKNRQGPDIGEQYRSEIFFTNEKQKAEAERSKAEAQKDFHEKIQTKINPAKDFYDAEEYHQKFYQKHPSGLRCA